MIFHLAHSESIKRMITKHDKAGTKAHLSGTSMFGIIQQKEKTMALEPGPMQVMHNFFTTKEEVLDDIKKLDLWPTVYVSERMEELPPHWHDVDNCGYVMEGKSYVLNEKGERVELQAGDKLHIPVGAIHAEGKVEERMVYIVGISEAANLFEKLSLLDPKDSPLNK